jgi:hypothetical protein
MIMKIFAVGGFIYKFLKNNATFTLFCVKAMPFKLISKNITLFRLTLVKININQKRNNTS